MNTCLMLWSIAMYLIFGVYASILFCRSARLGRKINEDIEKTRGNDLDLK